MTDPIKITITSDPSNIAVVRTAVESFSIRHGFTHEQSDQIGLAVNEALANVIEHAYSGDIHQSIDVSMDMIESNGASGRALKLIIRDFGRHVDPDSIKSRNLSDIKPGGLGVHIIKTIMDEVCYRSISEGGTELTMLKFA